MLLGQEQKIHQILIYTVPMKTISSQFSKRDLNKRKIKKYGRSSIYLLPWMGFEPGIFDMEINLCPAWNIAIVEKILKKCIRQNFKQKIFRENFVH